MISSQSPFLVQCQKKIDEVDIVSFDIFDTLLLRPYRTPVDLFRHLEQLEKMPNFTLSRQRGEAMARDHHRDQEDITFDQIYAEMDDIYQPMKDKELALEYDVLHANPEMWQVFHYALEKNKQIIILSDMYLPTAFIKKVLKKNGLTQYQKLYVSGDIGKTKYKGTLYRLALEELNVHPEKVLHIGDNQRADVKRAQEVGIHAIYYQQVVSQFVAANKRAYYFEKQIGADLDGAILLALMAWRWLQIRLGMIQPDYWSNIGYQYAGPVAYGYCRFAEKIAQQQNMSQLLFIARDGYTLLQVFKTFNTKIKSHYVYAPRLLNLICRLDYNPYSHDQAKTIVTYYSQKDHHIRQEVEAGKLSAQDIILKNKPLFVALAKQESQNYQRYLLHHISSQKGVGIVDTITGEFSSQRIVQNILSSPVYGIYWGAITSQKTQAYHYSAYIQPSMASVSDARYFTSNWNFIEFLITSPEYPIKNITSDGQPVYDPQPNPSEVWRAGIYPHISAGAVQFAEEINGIFNQRNIHLSSSTVVKWVNCFVEMPEAADKKAMNGVQFGIDSAHKILVPLFNQTIPWSAIVRYPYQCLKILKYLTWRTWPQVLCSSLFFPLKIRLRGLKKVELYLLPTLRKRFLVLRLYFSPSCYYQFAIGNAKNDKYEQ